MNKHTSFAIVILVLALSMTRSHAQNIGPQITFQETEHQFGTICQSSPTTYNFKFINTGDEPLEITQVRSSCGCLTPSVPNKTILPKEEGMVTLKYNSNIVGQFTKTVAISTNATNNPRITLRVRGNVLSADKNIYQENGKMGITDCSGNMTIPCIYDDIDIKTSKDYMIVKQNGRWGILSINNQLLIPIEYGVIIPSKDYIVASRNGRWGIINWRNIITIPFEYEDTLFPYRGGYHAKKNGKWGIINKGNIILSPFMYDNRLDFNSKGYAYAIRNGKWGIIDEHNNTIIPFEYDYIEEVETGDDFLVVGKNNHYGVINYQNIITIPIGLTKKPIFSNGITIFSKNGKCGGVNKNGKTVIPFEYESLSPFIEEWTPDKKPYAFAQKEGKYGMIDINNKIIIPFEYEQLGIGEINIITALYFETLATYKDGFALGKKNGKYVVIDKNNRIIATRKNYMGKEED